VLNALGAVEIRQLVANQAGTQVAPQLGEGLAVPHLG
jgi:hypothetical protein